MSKSICVSDLLNGQTVIPVVAIDNKEQAVGLAKALLAGGISVIEVTLRNDFGPQAVSLIKSKFPEMRVLAGTVNTCEQLHEIVQAGADGIISPGITPSLLKAAQQEQIPYLPGVSTASEVLIAIETGLKECKLFPATVVGGISALKAFSGPFSEIRFCPTGGINETNYQDFLALSNVMCVGGSWVAPMALIREAKWLDITERCKAITQ